MTEERIYLGRIAGSGGTYLTKHTWDCGWYWGFGYLGNKNCHFHINSLINHPKEYCANWHNVSHQFAETWITQRQWWIIRDLFIQAYALQKAAETYRYGGHQTQDAAPYRITDADMAKTLNEHLGKLLDNIWQLLHAFKAEYELTLPPQ